MSPALLGKYLDAAKDVAAHAVPLPDGFRFSRTASRRDWTDEIVADIRRLYDRFADKDGKLPLEAYLAATIELRRRSAARPSRRPTSAPGNNPRPQPEVPRRRSGRRSAGAGPADHTGGPLDDIRSRWKTAVPGDVAALAGAIRQWQEALWKFNNVGSTFDRDWQEPVTAMVGAQTLRRKMPESTASGEVVLSLSAGDAGDGREGDVVVWRRPRLELPGRPALLLRDVRDLGRYLAARRRSILDETPKYLAAAAEAPAGSDRARIEALARSHGLPADALAAWLDYLGLAGEAPARIEGYLTDKDTRGGGYEYVKSWRSGELPALVANASDMEVNIPGRLRPHGIVVHPSPELSVAIGWRSPIAGRVRVAATVADAHGGCGNGVAWSVELRRGGLRRRLAAGAFGDGQKATIAPIDGLDVQAGDLISLVIGPRDGNHGCDTTEVDLDIAEPGADGSTMAARPGRLRRPAGRQPPRRPAGPPDVWHFYTEPVGDRSFQPVVPAGSRLARWLEAKAPAEKARLAGEVERLLTAAGPPAGKENPDAILYRQARSLDGPLFGPLAASWEGGPAPGGAMSDPGREWGLDPSRFGRPVVGRPVDGESLGVTAPSVLEFRLPADLVAGREFVVTGELEPRAGAEGSVQLMLTDAPPRESLDRLRPGVPIVARDGSRARSVRGRAGRVPPRVPRRASASARSCRWTRSSR